MTESTMITGFIVIMIAIIILCYMAKVAQEAKDAKEERNRPAAPSTPLVVQPIATNAPATSVVSQDDDEELIAVISAAIAAISGSANVQILSIRNSNSKAWVLAGRQELMNQF